GQPGEPSGPERAVVGEPARGAIPPVLLDISRDRIGEFRCGLTTEVPLRVALFRVAETADEYVLAMVVHHISGDGSSVGPLTAYDSQIVGEFRYTAAFYGL
uniref:hypothetical protein n=1 Tax=Nocardia carnea TaxID=37328 RepID=UPI0024538CD9